MDYAPLHVPEKRSPVDWVTDINYIQFYVKFIQCSPVYKSIQISLIIAESQKWFKNLAGEPLKQWLGVWNISRPCRHTLQFRRLYRGLGGSVTNMSPLEYQKSLQCWKTITILPNAIYTFYIENIEFLIKVSDVKKPLYCINGLLVIIYGSHIVKGQPYCKHLNILVFHEIKFAFLKFSAYHSLPKSFLTVCCQFEAKSSSSV